MKKIIIILIFSFSIFNFFKAYAQIVFIDINLIINKSDVGVSLNDHINKIKINFSEKFEIIENELIKEEKSLLAQKNILEKEEFDRKLSKLDSDIQQYRQDKKKSQQTLNKIKLENTKKILEFINPLITNYVNKHSIELVMPKKNIIVGKKSLDITEDIIKLLNNKKKKLEFK